MKTMSYIVDTVLEEKNWRSINGLMEQNCYFYDPNMNDFFLKMANTLKKNHTYLFTL